MGFLWVLEVFHVESRSSMHLSNTMSKLSDKLLVLNFEDCFFNKKIITDNGSLQSLPSAKSLFYFKEILSKIKPNILLSNNPNNIFHNREDIEEWFHWHNMAVNVDEQLFLVSSAMCQNLFTEAAAILDKRKNQVVFLDSNLRPVNSLYKREMAIIKQYNFKNAIFLGNKRRKSLINEGEYLLHEGKESHFKKIVKQKVAIKKNQTITRVVYESLIEKFKN